MSKILLLESDRILTGVITTILERSGHAVVVASSAADGLNRLDEHVVDLIILELQLPLHNGIEFLYEIRSYADWQDIPVIVHSTIAKELFVSTDALQRLGVFAFLQKPYTTLQQILQKVNEVPSISKP